MQQQEQSPRNSSLRETVKKPLTTIAKFFHEKLPWLTPNEVTLLGTAGLGTFVLYVSKLEKENAIDFKTGLALVAGYAALSASDALDGSLARYKKEQGETAHDLHTGQLVDSLSDRVQEAFLSWLAMYRAAEQGDKLWLLTATLTALTNPLSSLVRAWAESQSIVVPESGTNAFEFLGTRAGRAITGATHMLPTASVEGVSGQAVLDGVTVAATTKTTLQRLRTIFSARSCQEERVANPELQADAQRRLLWLSGLAVLTGTTTALLAMHLSKKQT